MDDLTYYTVEFLQKPYVKKRGIVDSLLDEFVTRIKNVSKTFKPHPSMYGSQNGDRVRFVHFFTNLTYYDVNLIANSFAREKTFDYTVKAFVKPKQPVLGKGGVIDNFFMKKKTLKEIFSY